MTLPKKRDSRSDSRKLALWQIGLLLILAGPLAHEFLALVWPLTPPLTNEQRGQAFGRGLASILSVVAGVILVAVHLVRKRQT